MEAEALEIQNHICCTLHLYKIYFEIISIDFSNGSRSIELDKFSASVMVTTMKT